MSAPRWAAARVATPSERLIEAALSLCGGLSVLTTLAILWVLTSETLRFFAAVPLRRFLGDTAWTPLFADARFGIWPLLSGTLLTSAIACAVAVPLGLMAAIYLSEFARPRERAVLKPLVELLAGVPTVVYGCLALAFLSPLLQQVVPGLAGFNALSPGIVMGIMIVPVVLSLSEDALAAVPWSTREAAYALGARKLPTLFRVVLPAARSGIAAAVVLAVSRALGETMIVTIAAGQQPRLTLDPRVPIETMTAYIVQVSQGDAPAGSLAHQTLFVVGAVLFGFTLVMNLLGQRLSAGARRAG